MTAEPTTTYTSEQAYFMFLAGAIISIDKLDSGNVCTSARVIIGDAAVSIENPADIQVWLAMDADDRTAVRVPRSNGKWQHVAHAPKKMVQEALL